ncbi:DNA-directed RNA polymerases I and III subunit RPAC2 [Eucalyptus grandis]|uniref:DNA-directed RNA polymerases I and III subunit RPAC2 n=1 Tax=Eucalyptus grandis TaxID=71139 RepID=UPI00192ED018|nr:DNA-directed RNA polymerases I and III subunit RPAC2 [Eucalyptus grandis]
MECASFRDQWNATFILAEEDHTLANALRFTLNQVPQVIFCGYSIPHPSDARVNVRVQTTEKVARDVLKDACQHLMLRCQHIRGTFDKAVDDFRTKNPPDDHPSQNMDSD